MKTNVYQHPVILLAGLLLLQVSDLYSVSLVYILKVRRAFDAHLYIPEVEGCSPIELSALPIFYVRNKNGVDQGKDIEEKVVLVGSLFNVRATTPNEWWAELTAGVENQSITSSGTDKFKIAETGIDDIIFSAGKNFSLGEKIQAVPYVIAGFPFQQSVTPLEAQTTLVGTRFYGLGAGGDFSYSFIKGQERALIGFLQVRLVHFFSRSWYPILPFDARAQPGNVTDLFLIVRYREKKHAIELGYNPTFFTNQATQLQEGTIKIANSTLNSLYAAYEQLFEKSFLLKAPGSWGIGFSVGTSRYLNTKFVLGWVDINLSF